jgi:macrolide-specific efflux system membrane fusion protein
VLGTLDTADLQTAVDEASSAYTHAAQNLTAAQSEPGAQVSQINSAKDAKTRAWNDLQSAKADLASATLVSPIAGLVTSVNGTVGGSSGGSATGEGAASGFVTIADVSAYTVTANIAEADIAEVTVGQVATVTFPAIDGLTAPAKVTAVSPTASAENSIVSYATTITLDAVPEGVRLGQTAAVAIVIVSIAEDALYVPTAAITTASDGTATVDVVDPETGETETVTVETGVVGDEGTEITSGLELGDTIVIGIASETPTGNNGNGQTGTGPQFGTSGGPVFIDGGPSVQFGGK